MGGASSQLTYGPVEHVETPSLSECSKRQRAVAADGSALEYYSRGAVDTWHVDVRKTTPSTMPLLRKLRGRLCRELIGVQCASNEGVRNEPPPPGTVLFAYMCFADDDTANTAGTIVIDTIQTDAINGHASPPTTVYTVLERLSVRYSYLALTALTTTRAAAVPPLEATTEEEEEALAAERGDVWWQLTSGSLPCSLQEAVRPWSVRAARC